MFDPVKAEAAYKIIMRRGWEVQGSEDRTRWIVFNPLSRSYIGHIPGKDVPSWGTDPFTALVEADKWYTANFEQPANLPLPTGEG